VSPLMATARAAAIQVLRRRGGLTWPELRAATKRLAGLSAYSVERALDQLHDEGRLDVTLRAVGAGCVCPVVYLAPARRTA